jgi:hypothetical protein
VHEPPPPVRPRPPRPPQRPPRVLIVTTFSVDEPVAAIMDAANLLTGCDVRVTGDLARAPVGWPQAAAAHVTFTGWLSTPDYLDELRRADVVVGLTVDEQSVMRCAYEAIYLECVTVLSDTPVARRYFSPGVFCLNEGPAIAAGVRSALEDHALWRTRAGERRRTQLSRWVRQLDALAQILSSPAPAARQDIAVAERA